MTKRRNLFGAPVSDKGQILGCTSCPLNHAPGIVKIKGLDRIKGRKAFMWAMVPGPDENEKRLELVGPSGRLLWKTLDSVGLTRDDFDIQNVVRCATFDEAGKVRNPEKAELLCCSPYNDEALARNRSNAQVHVILGEVAGKQLLGKHYRKDRPIFWYAPWDAYVVLNYHPAYILRKGGVKAGFEYYNFRDRFRAARSAIRFPGRFGFLKSQNYTVVRTLAQFDEMEKVIRAQKTRVSFDLEDDTVEGKRVMLMAGFGTGSYAARTGLYDWLDSFTGRCFSVVLEHPQAGYERAHLQALQSRVKKLVEDAGIRKTLQNGSYDSDCCEETLGARFRGYDYDTQYGTFLRYSFLRSCSLENLTYRFYPEFCDYKDVVQPWNGRFAEAPIDLLALRNSGDCDITQRLEQRFSPKVRQPLVKVYIHAGKTLDKMEHRGPVLDRPNWKKASEVLPGMIKQLDCQLQQICGKLDFNCDASWQVAWFVYDFLKLPVTEELGRTTDKTVLERLQAETGNKTLELILKRRTIGRLYGTYVKGFNRSADLNNDELRTIFWLTGAVTGRLRSGKGDRAEAEGIINFQNLANNPILQNMIVADKNWRKALDVKC